VDKGRSERRKYKKKKKAREKGRNERKGGTGGWQEKEKSFIQYIL
jgi:hypothetical protein